MLLMGHAIIMKTSIIKEKQYNYIQSSVIVNGQISS